ncbi:MAG: TonB family protein [Parvularculaceae bacterium]
MAQERPADVIKFSPSSGETSVQNGTAGAMLAAAREKAGLSVEGVSAAIKVKAEHLKAIEATRPDLLPAMPYATGFVRTYARHLGLDGDALAAQFRTDAGAAKPVSLDAAREVRAIPVDNGPGEGARMASIVMFVAVALFFIWIAVQIAGAGRQPDQAKPETHAPVVAAQPPVEAPKPRPVILPEGPEVNPAPNPALFGPAPEIAEPQPETQTTEPQAAPLRQAPAQSQNAAPAPARAEPAPQTEERPLPRRARQPRAEQPVRKPVIVEAVLTRSAAPSYPERCSRGARDVESVTVRFDVSAEGRAVNMRIAASTNDCFETEALNVMQRWRFSPRTVDGAAAVEQGKTATLNFRK